MSEVERLAIEIRGLLRKSFYDPATWWHEGSDDLPAALAVDLTAAGWRHGGDTPTRLKLDAGDLMTVLRDIQGSLVRADVSGVSEYTRGRQDGAIDSLDIVISRLEES